VPLLTVKLSNSVAEPISAIAPGNIVRTPVAPPALPLKTSSVPPLDTVALLIKAPLRIARPPGPTVGLAALPKTSASPPLLIVVLLAVPPEETISRPPLLTVVVLAVPTARSACRSRR
jgi:hypothetical protein